MEDILKSAHTYSEVFSTDAISERHLQAENRVMKRLDEIYNLFAKKDGDDLVFSDMKPSDYARDPALYKQCIDNQLGIIPGNRDERRIMAAGIAQTM